MILLIDNYDSFVYNLARYLAELGCETEVVRNDRITVEDIVDSSPDALVLSPGPCTPSEAGISLELVQKLHDRIPMLGVCLGHQVIAAALGSRVIRAPEPVHGRCSSIRHAGNGLFQQLDSPLMVTRYHSLIVDESSLPDCLIATAHTEDDIVMAIEHRQHPVYGVQFHPESVLTSGGHQLLWNFLQISGISTPSNKSSTTTELSPPQNPSEGWQSPAQPLHW